MSCIEGFYEEFKAGLSSFVELDRPVQTMCFAIPTFKECIAKIPNLPATILVSNMVSMADKFYNELSCQDFEEPPEPYNGIRCYVCKDEADNDACNKVIETCPYNKQSCQTKVRVDTKKANQLHITKKCFNPTANDATQKQWETPGKSFIRYGCFTDLCNDGLFEASAAGGGGSGGGGGAGGAGGDISGEYSCQELALVLFQLT